MSEDLLVSHGEPGITQVVLNRPDRLNALTHPMARELRSVLRRIMADDECSVVVLSGAGRGFCAGTDLKASREKARLQRVDPTAEQRLGDQDAFGEMVALLRQLPQAVIAAVDGPAVGAGLALALGADIRVVGPDARFLVGAVKIGLTAAEAGITYLLPRAVGTTYAMDMMLSGREVRVEEALRVGLASRSTEGDVVELAMSVAREVVSNGRFGTRLTKDVALANLDAGFVGALLAENRTQVLATMSAGFAASRELFNQRSSNATASMPEDEG